MRKNDEEEKNSTDIFKKKKEGRKLECFAIFFFFFVQKHSFSNIFNVFKFHRVIFFVVISSRDPMDYLGESSNFQFHPHNGPSRGISPPSLRGFDEIIVVGHTQIPFDETEKREMRGGTPAGTLLIGKMDVRGRMAIGHVPMGIFNANFSVIFNSVVVFMSSLNFSKFLDRES